VIKTTQSQWSC